MLPFKNFKPSILSVRIGKTNYIAQNYVFAAQIFTPSFALFHQLTAMLHNSGHFLQPFIASRDRATFVNVPDQFQMIIHCHGRSSDKHVCPYSGPQTSETVAIIPEAA